MAGFRLPALPVSLDGVAVRGFLLVRRVRMILGLEVLGLVRGTFALAGHEFSKIEAPSKAQTDGHCPWRSLVRHEADATV
jgi:hypothetical protein